jgi:hypothetical protein
VPRASSSVSRATLTVASTALALTWVEMVLLSRLCAYAVDGARKARIAVSMTARTASRRMMVFMAVVPRGGSSSLVG